MGKAVAEGGTKSARHTQARTQTKTQKLRQTHTSTQQPTNATRTDAARAHLIHIGIPGRQSSKDESMQCQLRYYVTSVHTSTRAHLHPRVLRERQTERERERERVCV